MQYLLLISLALAPFVSALAVHSNSDFTVYQKRAPVAFPRHGSEALRRAYAKFGVPFPSHLLRRGQQGTAVNRPYNFVGDDNYPDDEYLSTICIGTPGQEFTIDLDTGSSDLWVYSSKTPLDDGRNNHTYYKPGQSLTSKQLKGYNWTITYRDGSSAYGDVYTDTVTFADVTFSTQAVEAAKFVSDDFVPDPRFDGYFGAGHDTGNQVLPHPQKTFFTNVAPSLSSPLFTASLNHLNPGSYDFGFIDPKKYSGPLIFFPSPPPPVGHGWWVINATGYSVGNTTRVTPFVGGLDAIVDTGTTFLLLAQQYCDAYYAKAPFVVNDPEYGYIYPCKDTNKLPGFTITIGSYYAEIPGYLIQGENLNSTTCFTGINPIPQAPGTPNAVFGDTFLKTTFTVFGSSPGQPYSLGFAKKNVNGTSVA